MKVLLTADVLGGVWTQTIELATGLAERGHEVVLASMGGRRDERHARDVREARIDAWEHRPYRLEWMDDPWSDVDAAGLWLLDVTARWRPDVVHLGQMSFGALGFDAPVLVAAHSCVLSWWRAVRHQRPPSRLEPYRARVEAGLRAADAVVAPTAAMLAEIDHLYGPLRSGIVIHNGLDIAPGRRIRAPIVVSAGRLWDEAKNAAALQRVAESLAWDVVLLGDRALGGTSFTATGAIPRPAVHEWMRRATIFAAPARYEPFGLAALEAAKCGCALVLGDIPSLREVWDDAATFVDPEDDEHLLEALSCLIEDPRRARDLAARASRRACAYDRGSMVEGYLKLYETLREAPVGARG